MASVRISVYVQPRASKTEVARCHRAAKVLEIAGLTPAEVTAALR